ncbi:MAG: acetyl-CoA carboxylase biotin carboxyl carrier protein [Chloroflexota bacterium]
MGGGGSTSGSSWDMESLRHILRELEDTDIDELEIERGSFRLLVRREPGQSAAVERLSQPPEVADVGVPIVAPLTGIFYSRPTPEQVSYAVLGDFVEVGQVVALIETMKLFNEVLVDVAGRVVEICAKDGDLVEVGQTLVRVEPGEGDEVAAFDGVTE